MANSTLTNPRFTTLLGLGKFITFMGWVVVIIGAIIFLYSLSQLGERSMFRNMSTAGLITGMVIAVNGLILVATGQIISCFVAIEGNTYDTIQMQKTILSFMKNQQANPEEIRQDKKKSAKSDKSATDA